MSTGIATFDYDGDGLIDVYFPNGAPLPGCTTASPPRHALYKNLGGWRFQDVTEQAGVACSAYGMGITVGDYDNDGHPDFYLNNFGPNLLFHNNGDGTFTDAGRECGIAAHAGRSMGMICADYDNDGDLDVVILNSRERPTILRNMLRESGHPNHWLQIQLRGTKTNRDGVGAHVTVVAGGLRQLDEVHSGRGGRPAFPAVGGGPTY